MVALRDYQIRISEEAANRLHFFRIAYLSMECRTGKTITALVAAQKYGADKVLFLTKKKAISSVMNDYRLLQSCGMVTFSIEVLNYESCHKVTIQPSLVVLDEAHCLGSFPKPSKRTKDVRLICIGKPVIYCSGTPSPESFSQLFHQLWCSSSSPFRGYRNFYSWAKDGNVRIMEKYINGMPHRDYSSANKEKILRETKHLFLSYSQEEAGFSTNIVERCLEVRMADTTKSYFDTMYNDNVVTIEDKTILGDTSAKLMSKLHQLSSGTVISEDGSHLTIDRSKADYIKAAFKGQKVAIFYVYQSEADLLHEAFPDWTESPDVFQSSADKTFICQVKRAREGVRLDSADALIFFNLEYSYLSYEQGRNRLVSKERKTPANVYFLFSNFGIERDILEAVHDKKDFTLSYYARKR